MEDCLDRLCPLLCDMSYVWPEGTWSMEPTLFTQHQPNPCSCLHRRINLAAWQRHEQLGYVRDIQFVSPIKGAFANWGVAHTHCYQSHR